MRASWRCGKRTTESRKATPLQAQPCARVSILFVPRAIEPFVLSFLVSLASQPAIQRLAKLRPAMLVSRPLVAALSFDRLADSAAIRSEL